MERNLQDKMLKESKKRGVLAFKTIAVGRRGYPDLTLYFPGGDCVLVEVKVPGGRLSPLQARLIRKLRDHGVFVYVIDTLEAFIELLEHHT